MSVLGVSVLPPLASTLASTASISRRLLPLTLYRYRASLVAITVMNCTLASSGRLAM